MRKADQKETLEISFNPCLDAIFQLFEHVVWSSFQGHSVTAPLTVSPETVPMHVLTLVCAGEFKTFEDWVRTAQRILAGYSAVCVDTLGRRCLIGRDFMRARDEQTFPLRYGWAGPADDPWEVSS